MGGALERGPGTYAAADLMTHIVKHHERGPGADKGGARNLKIKKKEAADREEGEKAGSIWLASRQLVVQPTSHVYHNGRRDN